ncbi:MATE efflux family protein 6 [Morus notabilis]|uniref:MATE efflux family protein 6 n=1 Tax=Morus notabilis TaxID=981085 RepID=W9QZQ0_9ROSA|nr:MATE efflux family protein 6 [Morus notabilis]
MTFLTVSTPELILYPSTIGIARGCGWQKMGAFVNLGAFYVVGVPTAIILAFVLHLKAKGLWLGITAAFLVQILFFLILRASVRVPDVACFGWLAVEITANEVRVGARQARRENRDDAHAATICQLFPSVAVLFPAFFHSHDSRLRRRSSRTCKTQFGKGKPKGVKLPVRMAEFLEKFGSSSSSVVADVRQPNSPGTARSLDLRATRREELKIDDEGIY